MKYIDRIAPGKVSALGICLVISIFSLAVIYGCGQKQNGGGGVTTNYTISGKLAGVSGGSAHAADASTVTDIVAIGANTVRYKATIDPEGNFRIGIDKGWPYVVGFYNNTGGTITLLGYLKQKDVDWDSLPIIQPTVDMTDLGTVEVNPASIEAVPSIALNTLISQMNMDLDVAQYYGQIDDPLSVLTNLDVDGNGVFDFSESVGYLFEAKIGMGPGPGPATGQIGNMLNGNYNNGYRPKPEFYVLLFGAGRGVSTPPGGSTATLAFPCQVYNSLNQFFQSSTTSVEGISGGGWTAAYDGDSVPSVLIASPEVLPSGTYTIQVSGGWNSGRPYTFKNVQGTQVVKVGATDKIIFPALNLVTNQAGYITTVNYKWLMLENGAVRDATLSELKAVIADTQAGENALVETSPGVGFMTGPNTLGGMKKMPLTGSSGSVDVSEFNILATQTGLDHVAVSYNLTSRVICDFRFGW